MALLQLAATRQIELAVSDAILGEVAAVLARPKFGWSPERIAEILALIRGMSIHVTPTRSVDIIKEDRTDNRILECAEAAGSELIITGDKHLLRLRSYAGIAIVKAAEFIPY